MRPVLAAVVLAVAVSVGALASLPSSVLAASGSGKDGEDLDDRTRDDDDRSGHGGGSGGGSGSSNSGSSGSGHGGRAGYDRSDDDLDWNSPDNDDAAGLFRGRDRNARDHYDRF